MISFDFHHRFQFYAKGISNSQILLTATILLLFTFFVVLIILAPINNIFSYFEVFSDLMIQPSLYFRFLPFPFVMHISLYIPHYNLRNFIYDAYDGKIVGTFDGRMVGMSDGVWDGI